MTLIGLALSLAACGAGHSAPRETGASARGSNARAGGAPVSEAVAGSDGLPNGSRVLLNTTEPLSQALAAGGSLYFTQTIPADQHTAEIYELIRVDTSSGRVAATRRFTAEVDHALLADGSLWLTTSDETQTNQTTLWRLNPRSLALRSRWNLPTARGAKGQTGSLAVAEGHLWVGTGTLDRVSLTNGRVDRVVHVGYPGSVQVAADASGRILLASLGYEHPTYIARLNPRTGAIGSQEMAGSSLSQPTFAGVTAGGAWLNNTTGATSTAWRLNAGTLKPARASGWAIQSERISAQVIDGTLWVTELAGQDNLNYCADPVTGRLRARLPLLPGDSVFLTADASSIYYSYVPVNARAAELIRAPISRSCLS